MAADDPDLDRPGLRDPALTPEEQRDVVLVRHAVQWLLRIGLVASCVLMATGLLLKLTSGDDRSVAVRLFGLSGPMATGDRLMAVGILVLAATPALRVLSLVILWTWERDWRFVMVALVVTVTLAVALLIGHG